MTEKRTLAEWQALAAKEVKNRDLTWATPALPTSPTTRGWSLS